MAISRRCQTGYDQDQVHELIVCSQKLAYEAPDFSTKENKSFENVVAHSEKQMRDLLNYKYIFEPQFFQLSNPLNYKAANTWLEAEEFLPSLKIDANMAKKINILIQDGMNSTFFLTGSSFEPSSHDLGNQTFFLDKASFDFEDSFEKALYGRKEYSVSCFCIGDSSKNIKPSSLIMEQVKETVKGLSSFKGMEVSYSSEYQYRRTDLLYLNHFRIFLFFSDQGEGVKIQRFIYYPRVNFSTQLISQPFRFVSTPLTSFLAQKTKNINISLAEITKRKNTVRYGFLGLDSTQRMLPLCASDDYCVSNPLIGVWTYGINYTENSDCDQESRRFVWSLLAEFSKNTTIAQRFSFDSQKKSFILAVFNLDESAKYFEVCLSQSENEEISTDNNSEGIMCSWCMLKNYSVPEQQQQGSKKYNQPQDGTSKLTQELLFRFSPKMVVDQFDDEEFCQPQEEPRNKQQAHIKQQSQKGLSNIQEGSNNNETVKMIGNRNQKYNKSQIQEDESLHAKAAKVFENMQTSKQALRSQIEMIKQQEECSREKHHIQANNQTFSQNSNIEQQSEQKEFSHNGLPQVAEKIIKQQQEQIDQMKEQIQQLTNALMTVKQQQSQHSQMSQSYIHQTQSPISQSQLFTNQSQQMMLLPQRYLHPQQQMFSPNQHPQHYPPYPFQGYYPPGYMFDPYNQHQYFPFPPGGVQEPYGMYQRGGQQGYLMHESIISGDGKSNRSVDSIHLANKKSMYQDGNNHNKHIIPSNASDFAMSEVQSIRNNYEDMQSVKNKEEEAEDESFKQMNYAPFHAQINIMKAKQLQQSQIPGEQISFAQNSFAGEFNQQTQDSFEQQNQQQQPKKCQVPEGQQGKQNISQQQLQQQNMFKKHQQQQQKYEHIDNNLKESNHSSLNNCENRHSSSQEEDDQVQKHQYQTKQYNSKSTLSSEPKELDSKISPISFINKNTPTTSMQTSSTQSYNKGPVQTKEISQSKENKIDQRMQLELARKAVFQASLDSSEETFTMDEKSHPKMNLDFLDQPNMPKGNYSGKTASLKGKDQKAEIPTIKYHDYAFDSDSDEEVKVIQKKYNMRN